MKDFARWWKRRETASYLAEYNENHLSCTGTVSPDVYLRISKSSSETVVPFQSNIDLATLPWKDTIVPPAQPFDIRSIRQFSTRRALQSLQTFLTRKRL